MKNYDCDFCRDTGCSRCSESEVKKEQKLTQDDINRARDAAIEEVGGEDSPLAGLIGRLFDGLTITDPDAPQEDDNDPDWKPVTLTGRLRWGPCLENDPNQSGTRYDPDLGENGGLKLQQEIRFNAKDGTFSVQWIDVPVNMEEMI